MKTDEIEKLLPCPFCGNVDVQMDDRTGRVHCLKCGADGPVVPYAPDPMFWTWNTRTPDLAADNIRLERENERLRKALERIAEHKPSFDYIGSDDYGLRADIPGSPYDCGKEYMGKLLSGIARAALEGGEGTKPHWLISRDQG